MLCDILMFLFFLCYLCHMSFICPLTGSYLVTTRVLLCLLFTLLCWCTCFSPLDNYQMIWYVCMYVFVSDWLILSDYLLIVCSCSYNSFDKFHVYLFSTTVSMDLPKWYDIYVCMYVCNDFPSPWTVLPMLYYLQMILVDIDIDILFMFQESTSKTISWI